LQEKREKGFYILLAISYLLIYLLLPITEKFRIPIFGNFLGHLPEFLLGIAFAMFPKFNLKSKHIFIIAGVFIVSNLSEYTFPFSFLSVTILLLAMIYPLLFLRKTLIMKSLIFIGEISMIIFLINGQLRFFTLRFVPSPVNNYMYLYMWAIIHLSIVLILSYGLSFVYDKTLLPFSEKLYKKYFGNQ
jgi:hypothetical protein